MMTPAAATKVAVADALRVLTEPGQVVELRILNAPRVGTVSGYFDDPEKLADAAARWSGKAPAVYVTPNPVNPRCSRGRTTGWSSESAARRPTRMW